MAFILFCIKIALMKIFLPLVLCFCSLFNPHVAYADEIIYARVVSPSVYFYSAPNENSALFCIPSTYFVELSGNAGESFYRARYLDLYGYVKKSEVTAVIGTPITPFAEKLSCRVISLNGLEMRSLPKSNSPFDIVCQVPYLETDIIYYGSTIGDSLVPDCTNVWYYCKYLSGTTSQTGFLYSLFCDKLTSIVPNTEVLEIRTEPLYVEKQETGTTSTLNFSSPVQIFIVIAVSLPCIIIVYLLFKPTKIVNKEAQKDKPKKKIRRLKKSDYYELDD